MGRRYKNPPVVEAICEFRMTPETPWDLAVPGLFYEKVKETFPRREQRSIQELNLISTPQGLQQQIRVFEIIVLSTENSTRFAQLGTHMLAVSVLKPYPTWQGFKPLIVTAWQGLQSVVDIKGLQSLSLRYINQIDLRKCNFNFEDYFKLYPFIGKEFLHSLSSFMVISDLAFSDGKDSCRVHFSSPSAPTEGVCTFYLDILYYSSQPQTVAVSDALDWVEQAHTQVEEIFEGCITDRLRDLFEEVP